MNKDNMELIKGKTILITGGTGSFGSTMVKSLLSLTPKEIIIFSRDELKQFEMRNSLNSKLVKFVIGDIRDFDSVNDVMKNVDFVFHAAALKQVPAAEFFPIEAVKTNILGGNNVMRAAINNGVKRVIILSTDKAVYPINAMGLTKALLEKTMVALATENSSSTIFSGVRYGNVMYSRGSVVPFFISQIKSGKKLSITNPRMTRFLLPLSDSVKLVFHALSKGNNGSMYVKKAPAADMLTLANALCEIFNYKKGVEVVGIRAGEKIHETLVSREEWARAIDQTDFYEIPPETKAFDYDKYFTKGQKNIQEKEGYTSDNTQRLTLTQTKKLLLSLEDVQLELKNYERK